MQAYARVHPNLSADLYLAHTSQDAFTFFSPLYAGLIQLCGLTAASTLLFVTCTVGMFVSAWFLIRALTDVRSAWIAVGMLACLTAPYGAYRIFTVVENYLTARCMAEALIVGALAAFACRYKRTAAVMAVLALLIHPLMALPGALLLLFVEVGLPVAAALVLLGVAASASVALLSAHGVISVRALAPMDHDWLEVVRQRSQFLFLRYWTWDDWSRQLRIALTLCVAVMVTNNPQIKRLCVAACLVGVAGLALTALTDLIGPIAIFVQGQPWRWTWPASFLAVVLLAPTFLALLRWRGLGEFCSVLLLAAWTFSPIEPALLAGSALLLCLFKDKLSRRFDQGVRIAAVFLLLSFLVAAFTDRTAKTFTLSSGAAWNIDAIRSVPAVAMLCVIGYLLLERLLRSVPRVSAGCALLSAASAVVILSPIGRGLYGFESARAVPSFASWREVIPAGANVLMLPPRVSCGFQWFTLIRPSYSCVNQSSGVVFSPDTAAEVRRRSQVLLPIMAADWRILAQFDKKTATTRDKTPEPLTALVLAGLCTDTNLGFVIAPEKLDYPILKHFEAPDFSDLNLYDCAAVREQGPPK